MASYRNATRYKMNQGIIKRNTRKIANKFKAERDFEKHLKKENEKK